MPSGEVLYSPQNERGLIGVGFAQLSFPRGIPLTKQPRKELCLLRVVCDKNSSYKGQPATALRVGLVKHLSYLSQKKKNRGKKIEK